MRFAAVGGAPVSPRLLQRAADLGLPVFEGYGLSECASVVCLNTPGHHKPGSVGRPLPHLRLRVADDGEVTVSGQAFSAYLGEKPSAAGYWPTGDLGELDEDGFLYLRGRRRNVFITAFGRNVAPEWVERELTLEPAIAQAAVFGEAPALQRRGAGARVRCIARRYRGRPGACQPWPARLCTGVTLDTGAMPLFQPPTACLTGTGRIRRDRVLARYGQAIESLYCEAQTS